MAEKSPDAFRTISEVAEWLGVNAHVLRFWESKFSQVKPIKRAGGRRYYRRSDMELLGGIQKLLHEDGMTIKGVQKVLRDQGIRAVAAMSRPVGEDVADELEDAGAETDAAPAPAAPIAGRREPEPGPRAPRAAEPPEMPLFSHEAGAPSDRAAAAPATAKAADVPVAPEPETAIVPEAAPTPPRRPHTVEGQIIAPLPGPELTLAEAIARLQPRQIPAARLAPIHARLVALRARMDAGA